MKEINQIYVQQDDVFDWGIKWSVCNQSVEIISYVKQGGLIERYRV